jgi:hypothetical protein
MVGRRCGGRQRAGTRRWSSCYNPLNAYLHNLILLNLLPTQPPAAGLFSYIIQTWQIEHVSKTRESCLIIPLNVARINVHKSKGRGSRCRCTVMDHPRHIEGLPCHPWLTRLGRGQGGVTHPSQRDGQCPDLAAPSSALAQKASLQV